MPVTWTQIDIGGDADGHDGDGDSAENDNYGI
jgi:hypothetical protein